MWNPICGRTTQFMYFDAILERPAWKESKILDFGGNIGGFLVGAGDAVNHDDYWCIDINKVVVEQGRRNHPRAHFVHFNRYSTQYNPEGIRNLPIPDCGLKFDIIIAFSVFTHVHPVEIVELVYYLRSMLTPQGVLAFTFTDPSYDRTLTDPSLRPVTGVQEMLRQNKDKIPALQAELLLQYNDKIPGLQIEEMVQRANQSKWCLLIDTRLYVEPGDEFSHQQRQGRPEESYCSYFKPDWIQSLFPDGKVHAPVRPEWQHCCVLTRSSRANRT
jgi:SAM-dependent methyltransferase